MLVLTRKANEQILIGDDIKITLVRVRGNSVRVGIEAPREVRVVRGELVRGELAAREMDLEVECDADGAEQETVFAHPQEKIGRHTKPTPANRLAESLQGQAESREEHPRIYVGRIRRAVSEATTLNRAPLAGFVSAT